MNLRIDKEFRDLIPSLSKDERTMLEVKLATEGCTDPVRFWEDDPRGPSVIDGHNRKSICDENGFGFKTVGMKFVDRNAVRLWILENQCSRRNLTDDQRAAVYLLIQEERTKKSLSDRGKAAKDGKIMNDVGVKLTTVHIRAEVAKEAKVSESKMRQMAAVAKASPKKAKEIRDGTKTIRQAKAEIGATEAKSPPPVIPPPEPSQERKQADPPQGKGVKVEPVMPTTDENGVALPDDPKVLDAFAARDQFDEWMQRFSNLKRDAGEFAKEFPWLPLQPLETHLRNCRHVFKFARPFAVCPYCSGKGGKCQGCKGAKWVTEVVFKNAPKKEGKEGAA